MQKFHSNLFAFRMQRRPEEAHLKRLQHKFAAVDFLRAVAEDSTRTLYVKSSQDGMR